MSGALIALSVVVVYLAFRLDYLANRIARLEQRARGVDA